MVLESDGSMNATGYSDPEEKQFTMSHSDTSVTLTGDESVSKAGGGHNSNNPFIAKNNRKTTISNNDLVKYPFKTLNRILDDIKWSIPYKNHYGGSLLNQKPIDYSNNLSKLVNGLTAEYELITLNNNLNFSPTIEVTELEDSRKLTIIRGLLVTHDKVSHFRLIVLENPTNPFVTTIDKCDYHLIPSSVISSDDRKILGVTNKDDDDALFDDSLFASSSASNNQLLRASIYKHEFDNDDLVLLIDQGTIEERYLKGVERHPNLNLSSDVIPNYIHCFKTLLRALRGPILLKDDEVIKTISLNDTVLDSQIDINLLLNKLHFTLNSSGNELIPPNLSKNPHLKEAYMRKIQELIFLGRVYGQSKEHNEFLVNYSYSDNLSIVFKTFNEFDKHICMTYFKNHNSSRFPFMINLSICTFFRNELIIKCFENTIASDPSNKLHYVDSLKSTINSRSNTSNNKLRSYYQNLVSRGEIVGYDDYISALHAIGLRLDKFSSESSYMNLDDESVITMYKKSYENDPKNYQYFRNNLETISKVINSKKLFEFLDTEVIPIRIAMEELNIEEITEDEVAVTAYEFKLNECLQANGFVTNDNEIIFLNKSLLSVALNRKSYLLLNYIETKLPQLVKTPTHITTEDAYSKIGCDSTSTEPEIISKFQEIWIKAEPEFLIILRYCFKLIAEDRKSEILISYLKTGKVDPSLFPSYEWPAGLDNIGNTCYLNSLLQYYFCIKPLREMILSFNENDIDPEKQKNKKVGGRKVEEAEVKRSNQFIYHLRDLFNEMIHTKGRCVQPSKELAYLSFLPLSQPVNFKVYEEDFDRNVGDDTSNPIIISSQSATPSENDSEDDVEMLDEINDANESRTDLDNLNHSDLSNDLIQVIGSDQNIDMKENSDDDNKSVSGHENVTSNIPKVLPISTDQIESTIEIGRQQDVTECMENVTFQIESALEAESLEEDGEQVDLIKKLFYGKTKQIITPLESSGSPRVSNERFFSLIINVGDHPRDIYDSLDSYFNEDSVKLEEGLAKKSLTISKLPDVLQFHVQRVLFDRERLMPYKSLEPIPFSENIFLDRYLDTDDEDILQKRSEVFKWKTEIKSLNDKKTEILHLDVENGLSIIDSLIATKKFLESKILSHRTLKINPATIMTILDQISKLKQEVQSINNRLNDLHVKCAHQFDAYTQTGYRIFAIFIHRGEASYGHYWIYIKDPHKDIFRKYNDETVTEVPSSEVFNFTEGNTATPYYIVYVKDELMKDYIEPLKRVAVNC
ncbi:uncharacterized protein PRCAT00000861001 [Priceomyces carsonii]|uniref:uncharacterized protein n=1 Tax=Priceomyces carsonii TaxID=28549 RepID=UPI002EDABC53|nr:unnamed protein product [Priceomyces carsonii]